MYFLMWKLKLLQQVVEEQSDSTTLSATSPIPAEGVTEEEQNIWKALSQNGRGSQGMSGEASQLLRKLITCRKLGMSITPAPLPHSSPKMHDEDRVSMTNIDEQRDGTSSKSSSARRKQSFPTKATSDEPPEGDNYKFLETEGGYIPDFTGNSPWCNLQLVKSNKVRDIYIYLSIKDNRVETKRRKVTFTYNRVLS